MRAIVLLVPLLLATMPVLGGDRYDPTAGLDPNRPPPSAEARLQQVVLAVARDPWSAETREHWTAFLGSGSYDPEEVQQLIAQVLQEAEAYRGLHPETRGDSLGIDEWRNRARGNLGRIAAGLG